MKWFEELDKWAADYLPDMLLTEEEPMSRHTSFRIGGPARRMAFPQRAEQLVLLEDFARRCGARPLLIGNGTNLLCPDEGIDRLVINTSSGLTHLEMGAEENTLVAECGVSLARLASFAAERGLAGLAFAHGIPGTVGGGLAMNAGAYGGEMKQVLRGASVLFPDEGVKFLSTEEMDLSYRHSCLSDRPDAAVLYGVFALTPGEPEEIRRQMRDLLSRRREKQPLEFPSAGSTFKRPEGHFAAALIDQCGLKGLTVGGAQVSEKHGGFVINRGGATFADVTALMAQVQQRVVAETGIWLEPEVKIISG